MSGSQAQPPGPAWFPPPGAPEPEAARPSPWAHTGLGRPEVGVRGEDRHEAGLPPALRYGAAHKPGVVPLRPLRLGDVFDAAFKVVRFNPRATAVPAVLLTSVALALPILITAVTAALRGELDLASVDTLTASGAVGGWVARGTGLAIQLGGMLLLTGLIAGVTQEAALGRRLTLGEAWAMTRGTRWRVIGLLALAGAAAAVTGMAYVRLGGLASATLSGAVAALWWVLGGLALTLLWTVGLVRFSLVIPALAAERLGIGAGLRRSWRLSRGQFWRLFGTLLLAVGVALVATLLLAMPLLTGGQLAGSLVDGGRHARLFLVVGQVLGQITASAFALPFGAGVASLLYLDQRIRKEAYDVELMTAAGVTRQ